MVQQILFLFKSPGWLLMALLTPTLPLSLYFLILLIMRDLELLPLSPNLDLTSFILTDLTFSLTLMVIFSHFRFLPETRSLHYVTPITRQKNSYLTLGHSTR